MSKTALILIAHGSRDPEWAAPFKKVCRVVGEKSPQLRLELAFMELMSPGLAESADKLVGEGFERIVVLPMFLAQGGHLKEDIPQLLNEVRERHPQTCFELTTALGDSEDIVQAMAVHVLALAAG